MVRKRRPRDEPPLGTPPHVIFSPERPRWAEAAAVVLRAAPHELSSLDARWRVGVEGITDPREAWEALATAGIVPYDAIDDPRRSFTAEERPTCAQCRTVPESAFTLERWCQGCGTTRREARPFPASVLDAVTLASDWPAILAAEEVARVYQREVCRYEPEQACWKRVPPEDERRLRKQFSAGLTGITERATTLLSTIDARGYLLDRIRQRGVLLLFAVP